MRSVLFRARRVGPWVREVESRRFNCGRTADPSRDDDTWRKVIVALAPNVGAVVVDGDVVNQNIEWELRTVLAMIPPERLLVLVPHDSVTRAPFESRQIYASLREIVGPGSLSSIVPYRSSLSLAEVYAFGQTNI